MILKTKFLGFYLKNKNQISWLISVTKITILFLCPPPPHPSTENPGCATVCIKIKAALPLFDHSLRKCLHLLCVRLRYSAARCALKIAGAARKFENKLKKMKVSNMIIYKSIKQVYDLKNVANNFQHNDQLLLNLVMYSNT